MEGENMLPAILIYVACIGVLGYFLFKSRRRYNIDQIIMFDEDVPLEKMSEAGFREYLRELLEKNGYDIKVVAGCDGADFLGEKDGVKYALKCVEPKDALEISPIHKVNEAKESFGCHVGVVITGATFAAEVISMAAIMGIVLWDNKKIKELIK